MSDRSYTWDLDTPHPNVDLDTLRRAIKQALEDLQAAVEGVQAAQAAVDDQYWLSDLTLSLLDDALGELAAAAVDRQQLRADLDALTARVAALGTAPPEPPEVP